jgi:hypothetical protein
MFILSGKNYSRKRTEVIDFCNASCDCSEEEFLCKSLCKLF